MSSKPRVDSNAMISESRVVGVIVRRSTLRSPMRMVGWPEKRLLASDM
jgi:hypothetical protein